MLTVILKQQPAECFSCWSMVFVFLFLFVWALFKYFHRPNFLSGLYWILFVILLFCFAVVVAVVVVVVVAVVLF